MPWKETSPVNERMRFVMEVQRGEISKVQLCRLYGISRPTGDKWLARFQQQGVEGLMDRSRAPRRHPNEVAEAVVAAILETRGRYPYWGPKKLRAWLQDRYPSRPWPATSTFGAVLRRHGLTVPRRRRRRTEPSSQPFGACTEPNAIWCADYKGWFRTGDGRRCEPLTISDAYSRYVLRCQATERTDCATAQRLFEAAFREYGLPRAIRTDNGIPFAGRGIGGLSRLSVWWLKLGIMPQRIRPGHPEQNGRHERMHLTLKQETATPPQRTLRAQQRAFDQFREVFNHQRPHEALGQRPPGSVYVASSRQSPARSKPVEYPGDVTTRKVHGRGQFNWHRHEVFLGEAFIGEPIALEQLDDRHWLIRFTTVPLGVLDTHRYQVHTLTQAAKKGLPIGSCSRAPSAPLQGPESNSNPLPEV